MNWHRNCRDTPLWLQLSYHSKATQTCMCYRFTVQMLKYPFQVLNNLRTENCRETADIHDENRLLFRGHKDHRT